MENTQSNADNTELMNNLKTSHREKKIINYKNSQPEKHPPPHVGQKVVGSSCLQVVVVGQRVVDPPQSKGTEIDIMMLWASMW